jgi:hypothetical protein
MKAYESFTGPATFARLSCLIVPRTKRIRSPRILANDRPFVVCTAQKGDSWPITVPLIDGVSLKRRFF